MYPGATASVQEILQQFPQARRDLLIPILQAIQERHQFLSRQSMIEVGQHLKLPVSKVYGVATFYNQFKFQPPGKYHIQLCRGTACHVGGSSPLLETVKKHLRIEAGETTRDGIFSLEVVACIGACGLAPVISINGEFHAKLNPEKVIRILDYYRKMEKEHGNRQ
jgi:NADH-quinone oxidoreductase subunit E